MKNMIILSVLLANFMAIADADIQYTRLCEGHRMDRTGVIETVRLLFRASSYGNIHDEIVDVSFASEEEQFEIVNLVVGRVSNDYEIQKTEVSARDVYGNIALELFTDNTTKKALKKQSVFKFSSEVKATLNWRDTRGLQAYKMRCEVL